MAVHPSKNFVVQYERRGRAPQARFEGIPAVLAQRVAATLINKQFFHISSGHDVKPSRNNVATVAPTSPTLRIGYLGSRLQGEQERAYRWHVSPGGIFSYERQHPEVIAELCISAIERTLRHTELLRHPTGSPSRVVYSGPEPIATNELHDRIADIPILAREAPIPLSGASFAEYTNMALGEIFPLISGSWLMAPLIAEVVPAPYEAL